MTTTRTPASGAADKVLAYLDDLSDDAAAHIFPSDLAKCMTSECVVEVVSVRAGNPNERTVPLFSREQVVAALASTPAQPVAEPADTVVLNAAMRAIQQAIELIGAPTDERMRAVRRVLRGAVIVAEDDGKVAPLPSAAYAALPEYGINTASHAHFRVLGFTADQMRAFADATHALRASHGQAPAQPDPAYSEACNLATALFKKHFAHLPDYASGQVVWGLFDSTEGVILQIDNMVAGLVQPPTTSPQADSQPAPFEVADAMADSQYLAGVSAGWNAANADDPNAALQKLHESRAGYLKPLRAVLAKWGTPAPVGAEPVALLVRKNSWRDGQWEAAPPNSPSYGLAWAHQRVYVYTTPQPTQAQAGAVPLTDDPDCGGESCDCRSYCKRKGGQHGAESST